MSRVIAWALFFCLFSLFAQQPLATRSDFSEAEWRQKLLEQRRAKDDFFSHSPTSPLAGSERFEISKGQTTYVARAEAGIRVSDKSGPADLLSLAEAAGKWTWQAISKDVVGKTEGGTLASGAEIPLQAVFPLERYTLMASPGSEYLALLVFDSQLLQSKKFSSLLYFPPDAQYVVPAVLERLPELSQVRIPTMRHQEKVFFRFARIRFKLAGKEWQLTAYKYSVSGEEYAMLFIPFTDLTNGKESYDMGRFLEIAESADPQFLLDFNVCYNPLCNYANVYNCPIPPVENHLAIEIRAGEKAYPH